MILSPLLAGHTVACGGGDEAAPPVNIILISIDSLRADHMQAYGYERPTSPNLDRLAQEGALFETVIAESSWTIPSHATMLTGVGSDVHGMQHGYVQMHPERRTLAQILREHGYRTAGVFSGPYLHPVFGFGQGFDLFESVIEQPTDASPVSLETVTPETINELMEHNSAPLSSVTSERVTDAAFDFLASVEEQPFFLFLYYFDPHYDYNPPEEYWREFDPDYGGAFTGRDFAHNPDVRVDMDPRDLEHMIARYDGEILHTDHWIGRLLDGLERNGMLEETLVMVTSDHGEEFFEHENRGHRRTLFDEVLKVPLLARLPRLIPAGLRIKQPVRHLDIPATLLSVAGVQEELDGVDLTPVLTGMADVSIGAAVSRLIRTPLENEWVSVRTTDFKYVMRRQGSTRTELFFDLRDDPAEQNAIITRRTRVERDELWGSFVGARDAVARQEAANAPRRDVAELDTSGTRISPEIQEQLRALGYVK